MLLSLVMTNVLLLQRLNINNNAFLNDTLDEKVYMTQPSGFLSPSYPNNVYKLKKAIFGLKQLPHLWYTELDSFFDWIGLQALNSRQLFIFSPS